MFGRKRSETNISVKLEELLTTDSCLTIIMEVLKYLLYQKQQVPFSCDSLKQLKRNMLPNDKNAFSINMLLSILQKVYDDLNAQFHIEGCNIKEIIIMIGPTIMTPKICIRLELPSHILSSKKHPEMYHPSRKPLINLMKSMFESCEFQEALSLPLGLTNTFIFVQKIDMNMKSEFFIPKPDYIVPTHTVSFRIKLIYDEQVTLNCNCTDQVKVYDETVNGNIIETCTVRTLEELEIKCQDSQVPYQWYQSREVIKGFKFLR